MTQTRARSFSLNTEENSMVTQVTEFPNVRNSGDHDGHKRAKAPKIKVALAPGRPHKINMEPIEAVRLLSTFGTADLGFASLMLSGLINASCSKVLESEDVNDALAAVSGIGARDEIERMLATQTQR